MAGPLSARYLTLIFLLPVASFQVHFTEQPVDVTVKEVKFGDSEVEVYGVVVKVVKVEGGKVKDVAVIFVIAGVALE